MSTLAQWQQLPLGQRIRAIRERDGLRAVDCAFLAGMSKQTWYHIESGRIRDPRWTTIQAIATALGCSADDLRGE